MSARALLWVALNWRNSKITCWGGFETAIPVWQGETRAAYDMDGTPYPKWDAIVISSNWWVPGFNEESLS